MLWSFRKSKNTGKHKRIFQKITIYQKINIFISVLYKNMSQNRFHPSFFKKIFRFRISSNKIIHVANFSVVFCYCCIR